MASIAARSRSTKVACAAPLDNASMPSAPLPAYRSRTRAPSMAPSDPSALNVASRTRSEVGRVSRPGGAARRSPPAVPATTLTQRTYRAPMTSKEGQGPIRIVRFDQPQVRNAVSSAVAQRLHDEFVVFEADTEAKVAVLTGDEQAFCAGANLRDLPD